MAKNKPFSMAKTLVEDKIELCDEKVALVKTTEILASSLKEACEEGRKVVVKGTVRRLMRKLVNYLTVSLGLIHVLIHA